MEVLIDDAKTWKSCVDAIVNLVDEGAFDIGTDAISLRAMDASQIAMINFSIPKKAFSKYHVDGPESVGVDLDSMSKILARSRGKESLLMKTAENRMLLEFKDSSVRRFKLPLLEVAASQVREPKLEFDAVIKIDGNAFKEVLKDASLVSSHVIFHATKDGLTIEAKGDSGDLNAELAKNAPEIKKFECKSEARAMFPLQYLDDMTKACGSELSLYLKTNAPVRIDYDIGAASLKYYLAPRIESA